MFNLDIKNSIVGDRARKPLIAKLSVLFLVIVTAFPICGRAKPNIDLSVSVSMSPSYFVPGGRNTITLAVHNGGPDGAGSISPLREIIVLEDSFNILNDDPPFVVQSPVVGCYFDYYISEYTSDGRVDLTYFFYFDDIPAGETHLCTYSVEFLQTKNTSFPSGFIVTSSSNDLEINSSNNRTDFAFQVMPTPVPVLSFFGLICLIFGIMILVVPKLVSSYPKRC